MCLNHDSEKARLVVEVGFVEKLVLVAVYIQDGNLVAEIVFDEFCQGVEELPLR